MEKISIIVPVYNCEEYLSACLDSILNQSYENIEVLCIDDNSTDHSLEILRDYQRDKRIHLLASSSKGCSMARNKGLEMAQGELITFVDADDYIAPNCLSLLSEVIKEEKLDIIYAPFKIVGSSSQQENSIPDANDFHYSFIDYQHNPYYLIDQSPNVWSKLYKRNAIKENFIPNLVWEDVAFTTIHSLKNQRIGQFKKNFGFSNPFYYYRTNPKGITASLNRPNKAHLDIIDVSKHILSSCKDLLSSKDISYSIHELIYKQLLYNLSLLHNSVIDSSFEEQLYRSYLAAFPCFDFPSDHTTRSEFAVLIRFLSDIKPEESLDEEVERNRFLSLIKKE